MADDVPGLVPLGPAGPERAARDVVAALGLRERAVPGRPRVVAAMIASLDGRTAVEGRSVALGHPADRQLLRELRTAADAVLVGTRTLAAERYANLLDEDQVALRRAARRAPHPVMATVSRALDLPLDVPLFAEAGVPIQVYTEHDGAPPPSPGADLAVERFDELTLPAVLEHLGSARGAQVVLCEGGPSLLRELVAQGGLDDLLLTVAPLLAAGDAPSVLEGAELDAPARLALAGVHRAGDHVVLHLRASR
ncbi:dihydrofolate reductase family protein [Conexibacter sp. SYSU D00693]|uniref:RibD family protein n=1 Tax=Conexibacter sp. SYSU D00693 TaxID=2812560 RepID=UPI00196B1100|nr:dihydrofolate reductase family protein [Conexibacter sp. SYSU D00693]